MCKGLLFALIVPMLHQICRLRLCLAQFFVQCNACSVKLTHLHPRDSSCNQCLPETHFADAFDQHAFLLMCSTTLASQTWPQLSLGTAAFG